MATLIVSPEGVSRWLEGRITIGRISLLVALISLILYGLTFNRTFGVTDKGELAAVASTLGIAHPTGYPTLTLLGYGFTRLLPIRPVLALNLLAALLGAASAGLLAWVFYRLLGILASGSTPALTPPFQVLYAGFAALSVALSETWWSQVTGFESYALQTLLIALVTYLFLRYMEEEVGPQDQKVVPPPLSHTRFGRLCRFGFLPKMGKPPYGICFAFALGLAFTNHLMTAFLLPSFLVYFLWRSGLKWLTLKRLFALLPGFLVGLTPYLYLPLRASMQPAIQWGDPTTLQGWFRHVTGAQYRPLVNFNTEIFSQQTAYFFKKLPADLGYLGLGVALLGIGWMVRRNLSLTSWTLLLFGVNLILAGGYNIYDIEPYYLSAIFALGVAGVAGLAWLHQRLGWRVGIGVAVGLAVLNGILHYPVCNERRNTLAEDYVFNVLQPLPANSILFTTRWDITSGALYLQQVERFRADVAVLDIALLTYSWYLIQVRRQYPDLIKPVVAEWEALRKANEKVARQPVETPGESWEYLAVFNRFVNALIEHHIQARPAFVTSDASPDVGARYRRVPFYLVEQLVPDDRYHPPPPLPHYRFRFWKARIEFKAMQIYYYYGEGFVRRAIYEERYGNKELARRYYREALKFDPQFKEGQVPDMPLNMEEGVKNLIRAYRSLRRSVQP